MSNTLNNVAIIVRQSATRIDITVPGITSSMLSGLSFVIATSPTATPVITITSAGGALTLSGEVVSVTLTKAQTASLTATRYSTALWYVTDNEPLSAGTFTMIDIAYPH